uniref:Uncharacterized protein n=1 Tax=Oryza brachyantha TaxID=4533 RepID=J3N401_ORYBR
MGAAQALLLLILAALAPASAVTAKQQGQHPHACGGGHTSPAPELPTCSGHRGQVPAPVLGLLGRRGSTGAPPPPRPHPPVSYVRPKPRPPPPHRPHPFPISPVAPPPPPPCL